MSDLEGYGKIYDTTYWGVGRDNNISWGIVYKDLGDTAASLLLDTYSGATAAYSLRLLRTNYSGNAIRVRRSDDNEEQDIGFRAGAEGKILDTTTLETFCGSSDGFVTTWYDQSGNTNNATQTTAASQPKIVSSGSTILENSKAAVEFDGTDDNLLISSFTSTLSKLNSHSTIILNKSNTNSGNLLSSAVDTNDRFTVGYNSGFLGIMIFQNPFLRNSTSSSSAFGSQTLISNYFDTTSASTYVDDIEVTTETSMQSSSSVQTTIGSRNGGGIYLDGNIQEMIVYNSDQLTNRSGIETNINDFYSIYTP